MPFTPFAHRSMGSENILIGPNMDDIGSAACGRRRRHHPPVWLERLCHLHPGIDNKPFLGISLRRVLFLTVQDDILPCVGNISLLQERPYFRTIRPPTFCLSARP